ncbi:MAG: hypothetical protein ACREAD_02210 [Nitrosopumilaceae archaeon]
MTVKILMILSILCFTMISANGEASNKTEAQQIEDTKSLSMATWLLAGGTMIIGIVSIGSIYVTHRKSIKQIALVDKQIERSDKQNQISLILEIFKLLNESEHRHARKLTYQAYREFQNKKDASVFESEAYSRPINMTAGDFDHIGCLIENEPVIKKMFLELYADTIIICWKCLEEHVKDEQNKRKAKFYMKFFERLNDEAVKYWHENRANEPLPEPY